MKTLFIMGLFLSTTFLNAQVTSFLTGNLNPLFTATPPTAATGAVSLSFTLSSVAFPNFVYASPTGGAGVPSFRSLVAADLPIVAAGTQGIISNNTASTQILGDGNKEFPDLAFFSDGGASTPAIGFKNSTNTGLYLTTGLDTRINISIAGNKRAHFTADGSFSISNNVDFNNQLDLNISHDANINDQDGGINVTTYGGTDCLALNCHTSTFTGRTASGSQGTPQASQLNQALAEFSGKGHTGSLFETSNKGVFGVYAAEPHSSMGQGAYCAIQTTKIGTTGDQFSFLIDATGNAGLVYANGGASPIFRTSLPIGWDSNNQSRFFSIESETNSRDAGLLIQNGGSTGAGVEGMNLWLDNSAGHNYFDNIANASGTTLRFRMMTSGTPVLAMTIGVDGTGTTGYTNFGGDNTPNNVLSVGGQSEFQISTAGKVVKYNNITTVSNGVPSEVATVDLTSQSAAIAATTMYTTPSSVAGMYRISWVAKVNIPGGVSSTLGPFNIKYTDADDNAIVQNLIALNDFNQSTANTTTGGVISGTFIAYAKAGSNIQYVMGYTNGGGATMLYHLHIKVEAL